MEPLIPVITQAQGSVSSAPMPPLQPSAYYNFGNRTNYMDENQQHYNAGSRRFDLLPQQIEQVQPQRTLSQAFGIPQLSQDNQMPRSSFPINSRPQVLNQGLFGQGPSVLNMRDPDMFNRVFGHTNKVRDMPQANASIQSAPSLKNVTGLFGSSMDSEKVKRLIGLR